MGRQLSPRYGQVILVSRYPVLPAVNWSQHWCAMCVQYQFSRAPKLARKCEIEHWCACGADGRSGYGHVITKFSWMGRLRHFISYGVPSTRASRARGASLKITEKIIRENAFKHEKKKPGSSANRPSNNWALINNPQYKVAVRDDVRV